MAEPRQTAENFWPLLDAACSNVLSASQAEELAALLESDPPTRSLFVDHMQLRRDIELLSRTQRVFDESVARIEAMAPKASPPLPSVPFLGIHGSFDNLSSGWAVAYLIATVVVSIGITIAAITHVSDPESTQLVQESDSLPCSPPPRTSVVGHITGMVDCAWEGSKVMAQGSGENARKAMKSSVAIGDRLAISSGLLEITYNTGAKVILQGPVTYEVESAAGGYLAIGKLTARLENNKKLTLKKEEQSASRSSFSVPSSSFAVRTPTAIVTDLGTEFGVEVPNSGDVTVHVFEGKVECRSTTPGLSASSTTLVTAGQTSKVGNGKVNIVSDPGVTKRFVRSIANSSKPSAVAPSTVLAYWRFEEEVPPATSELNSSGIQDNVIRDWSNHWNHLNYCPALPDGIGTYVASTDVPPKTMFRGAASGGSKSFNSGALDPQKCGVLFHDAAMHGYQFNFTESFTIEGFFKTDGNQSASDMMAILFKGTRIPAYLVSVNRKSPGAVQFTLFSNTGKEVSATVSDRNYADGRWHYFAASYSAGRPGVSRVASLLIGNEDGSCKRGSKKIGAKFVLNTPMNDLLIGRKLHHVQGRIEGHFHGLIDELRIHRGVCAEEQLLFAPAIENRRLP